MTPKEVHISFRPTADHNGDAVEADVPSKKRRKAADGSAVGADGESSTGVGKDGENVAATGDRNGVKSDQKALSNPVLLNATTLVKLNLLDFVENLNSVKMWIHLNIPRIEDGNNFGVGIQEETLAELERAEEAAFGTLESIPKYFLLRAKYITKTIKYPGVVDFENAVHELDQKEYLSLCMTLKELRNNYSILHDMISKNWEKIVKPRSESSMVY